MNASQWRACRAALLRERTEQKQFINRLEESGLDMSMTESIGDLSSYDNHPSDHGTEMYEREKDIGWRDRAKGVLEMVDHALARMAAGTYTVCEECGRDIGTDRLLALPYASRCRDCEEDNDQVLSERSRPAEKDVLGTRFSRGREEDPILTDFDGDDAWEAVAQYGTANSPQDVPEEVMDDNDV